jgi:hypothetical protein
MITVAQSEPDVELRLEPPVVALAPGGEAELTVHVKRNNGFAGRVQIDTRNLPFGVVVANTGLNGVLVTEAEQSRKFQLLAEKWVQPMNRDIMINGLPASTVGQRYMHASNPIQLKIGEPSAPGQIVQK